MVEKLDILIFTLTVSMYIGIVMLLILAVSKTYLFLAGAATVSISMYIFKTVSKALNRTWHITLAKYIITLLMIPISNSLLYNAVQKYYGLGLINERQKQHLEDIFMDVETVDA
jgi:hypothetical protein